MDRFPRTKLILTSRPSAVEAGFQDWNRTSIVSIRPLTLDEISGYLAATLSGEVHNDAIALLKSETDLQRICSHPAHLAAVMRFFGEGYEREPVDSPVHLSPIPTPELEKPESDPGSSTVQAVDAENPESEKELQEFASKLREELERSSQIDPINTAENDKGRSAEEGEDGGRDDEDLRIPIPLGRALGAIYEYLWDRETERRNFRQEETDEWWETAGHFALSRDGHQPRFRKKTVCEAFGSDVPFYWLLHLAVLKQISWRLYAFLTDLTQAYFAADYIAQCIEANEPALGSLLNPCEESFRRRVLTLLKDISSHVPP